MSKRDDHAEPAASDMPNVCSPVLIKPSRRRGHFKSIASRYRSAAMDRRITLGTPSAQFAHRRRGLGTIGNVGPSLNARLRLDLVEMTRRDRARVRQHCLVRRGASRRHHSAGAPHPSDVAGSHRKAIPDGASRRGEASVWRPRRRRSGHRAGPVQAVYYESVSLVGGRCGIVVDACVPVADADSRMVDSQSDLAGPRDATPPTRRHIGAAKLQQLQWVTVRIAELEAARTSPD